MGVAIVSGIFAVVLAAFGWLLKYGSKWGRLYERVERQAAVVKDLPEDHPARADLDAELAADAAALKQLRAQIDAESAPDDTGWRVVLAGRRSSEEAAAKFASRASFGAAVLGVVAAAASIAAQEFLK